MELYVVMVDDHRHKDPEAFPFSTEAAALDHARSTADGWLVEVSDPQEGWLYQAEHRTEDDAVWVVRKFVDEPDR